MQIKYDNDNGKANLTYSFIAYKWCCRKQFGMIQMDEYR
ncbi:MULTISPECIES: hypothetical protein [Bacillus]|uniref:Uncharacterized protein n=1 Tax=Bacillus vallismortis TaxID=72361 RepID=A0AAP3CII9_BACVA|nr:MULTISPECIES: hypothetical protein [Bacillus]MCI3985243.1 hypothetical protein [Bacillus vallismortis]MCI4137774.1 hypothetical protein [Bacillus vallismortis]MCY7893322.1 hypothetical protein [Bacillus vallismortis]MCY7917037.1 hypothetical protein [Bacillus vallismortis]MCY8308752.1 hypothetical protein [Bacillus vallismortis]